MRGQGRLNDRRKMAGVVFFASLHEPSLLQTGLRTPYIDQLHTLLEQIDDTEVGVLLCNVQGDAPKAILLTLVCAM